MLPPSSGQKDCDRVIWKVVTWGGIWSNWNDETEIPNTLMAM
jgi:hypothetical protein